ncbi:MAG TPA: dihydropteroate synthase, partial [Burkholderiaceae bacterium]|nr:dihydropteroate synthase [Burkholderiaceae bacterium]
VDILNDILALRDPGAEAVMGAHPQLGVCLMHMRGDPGSMQSLTDYGDVVQEVAQFLSERVQVLRGQGVAAERIVVDPGYGFAKTVEQNFELLRRQAELQTLGCPLLAGLSRKSAIGVVTGRTVDQRLPGSLAAALLALSHGARILRVHDVAATVDALQVWGAGGGAGFRGGLIGENASHSKFGGSSQ